MTRSELAAYLTDTYSCAGEHLFARYPSFLVFRHRGSKKWFLISASDVSSFICWQLEDYDPLPGIGQVII